MSRRESTETLIRGYTVGIKIKEAHNLRQSKITFYSPVQSQSALIYLFRTVLRVQVHKKNKKEKEEEHGEEERLHYPYGVDLITCF